MIAFVAGVAITSTGVLQRYGGIDQQYLHRRVDRPQDRSFALDLQRQCDRQRPRGGVRPADAGRRARRGRDHGHADHDAILDRQLEHPGAAWIWSENPAANDAISNPVQKTFTRTFTWSGPVTSAILLIAADNRYKVTLNGNDVDLGAGFASNDQHAAADTYDRNRRHRTRA